VEWFKTIIGKVVTAGLVLGVAVAVIGWWQMDPANRQAAWDNVTRLGAWGLLVLFIPWALFWLIGWVAAAESNAKGALLVGCITLAEMGWLGFMFGFANYTAINWTFFVAAGLVAAVYNLLVCDWIAERAN
jgi:hypothetical protein